MRGISENIGDRVGRHTFPTNNCVRVSLSSGARPPSGDDLEEVAIWMTASISSFERLVGGVGEAAERELRENWQRRLDERGGWCMERRRNALVVGNPYMG